MVAVRHLVRMEATEVPVVALALPQVRLQVEREQPVRVQQVVITTDPLTMVLVVEAVVVSQGLPEARVQRPLPVGEATGHPVISPEVT